MSLDVSNAIKYAADAAYSVPASMGLHSQQIYLVTITTSGVDVFGESGTRARTDIRLTLSGAGIQTQADGYLNPAVEQVTNGEVFLSGGLLSDKDFRIGPIVFPYTFNSYSGGTDSKLLDPAVVAGNNVQFFFRIIGTSFHNNLNGVYLKHKWSRKDSALSYYYYASNTAEFPGA